jgi:hypothetical protein
MELELLIFPHCDVEATYNNEKKCYENGGEYDYELTQIGLIQLRKYNIPQCDENNFKQLCKKLLAQIICNKYLISSAFDGTQHDNKNGMISIKTNGKIYAYQFNNFMINECVVYLKNSHDNNKPFAFNKNNHCFYILDACFEQYAVKSWKYCSTPPHTNIKNEKYGNMFVDLIGCGIATNQSYHKIISTKTITTLQYPLNIFRLHVSNKMLNKFEYDKPPYHYDKFIDVEHNLSNSSCIPELKDDFFYDTPLIIIPPDNCPEKLEERFNEITKKMEILMEQNTEYKKTIDLLLSMRGINT